MGEDAPSDRAFHSTLWTAVLQARDPANPEALDRLCRTYWPPLYGYLRRRGHSPEDAQDTTQAFFAYLQEGDLLRKFEPGRGRFRGFLLACLENFLSNQRRKDRAAKRGGGRSPVPLDAESVVLVSPQETPEQAYRRLWTLQVLEQATATLRKETAEESPALPFDAFCARLSGDPDAPTVADLARAGGLSEADAKNRLHRMRRRLGQLIRDVLRDTVDSPQSLEEEVRDLFGR